MNIFYLDKNPYKAAEYLYDKHIVKMIVESAQMLSTCKWWYKWRDKYSLDWLNAKDVIQPKTSLKCDNWKEEELCRTSCPCENIISPCPNIKKCIKKERQQQYKQKTGLLLPTHINHPCNVWLRNSFANYHWLITHFHGLIEEYSKRYSKKHKYDDLMLHNVAFEFKTLPYFPQADFTEPPLCMPEKYTFTYKPHIDYEYKSYGCKKERKSTVQAYRDYYEFLKKGD